MRRLHVVVATATLGLGLAGPAAASTAQELPAGPSDQHPHCVVDAQVVGTSYQLATPRCFDTFAEAIAAATDGAVTLSPEAHALKRSDLNDAAMDSTMTSTVLGIEFEDTNFRGWSMTISGPSSLGCHSGNSYRVAGLPSSRNDEISSARTYNGCKSRHFSEPNLTGDSHLCGCSQMGTMNDRTSSIRFSATG